MAEHFFVGDADQFRMELHPATGLRLADSAERLDFATFCEHAGLLATRRGLVGPAYAGAQGAREENAKVSGHCVSQEPQEVDGANGEPQGIECTRQEQQGSDCTELEQQGSDGTKQEPQDKERLGHTPSRWEDPDPGSAPGRLEQSMRELPVIPDFPDLATPGARQGPTQEQCVRPTEGAGRARGTRAKQERQDSTGTKQEPQKGTDRERGAVKQLKDQGVDLAQAASLLQELRDGTHSHRRELDTEWLEAIVRAWAAEA